MLDNPFFLFLRRGWGLSDIILNILPPLLQDPLLLHYKTTHITAILRVRDCIHIIGLIDLIIHNERRFQMKVEYLKCY